MSIVVICALIWNIFIFTGTVYLIGWKGWSGAWILLALLLTESVKIKSGVKR